MSVPSGAEGVAVVTALEVRIGEGWFALTLDGVIEVVPMPWVQQVPEAPEAVLGTFRFGEEVTPLVDTERRLFGRSMQRELSHLAILVDVPPLVALCVRDVGHVMEIDRRSLLPPSVLGLSSRYLLGAFRDQSEGAVHLLDARSLAADAGLGDG